MKTKAPQKQSFQNQSLAFIANNKALVILLALCIVLTICSDAFLTSRNLLNVIRQACASSILGIGFTIVLASGNIDLSVGAILCLVGVISAKLSLAGLPIILVVFIALALGALLGMVNGVIINTFSITPFIATLATQSVFNGICYIISGNRSITGLGDGFKFLGQGYLGPVPFPIYLMVFTCLLSWVILNRTTFGRHCLAVGGSSEAAVVCGVNPKRITLYSYMYVGVCAALASLILTGRAASAQLTAGSGMEMDAIAAVVIGGTSLAGGNGNIVGTVFGCLIVQVINNGLNLLSVDSNYQVIAKGLLILIAVILDIQGAKLFARRNLRPTEKVKPN